MSISKHFVESKNPFLLVFVLTWHFNSISSSQQNREDAPTVIQQSLVRRTKEQSNCQRRKNGHEENVQVYIEKLCMQINEQAQYA